MLRALAVALLTLAVASHVLAAEPPRDPVAAETLFSEGQKLMDEGNYAAACPKLQESYRLDPATGALYALALCHERQGKLASAWVEFMDTASKASAEGYAEREQSAREHAETLEGRLSFLTVMVDPETAALENLVVMRDGVALGPAAWGSPIPVDPSAYVVAATAPGHAPWKTTVQVGAGPDRRTVRVPKLVTVESPASGAPREVYPELFGMRLTSLRIAGLSVGVAGIAGLGFATYSAARAAYKNEASKNDCRENNCNSEGEGERAAALEAANIATVSAIVGGALLTTGVVLFVLGAPADEGTRLSVGPSGVALAGTF